MPHDEILIINQVTDMDAPIHIAALAANEVLKVPTFQRRTAYSVYDVRGSKRSHRYSFIFDPEELGTSAVLQLKKNPMAVACHEYANGQYKPDHKPEQLTEYKTAAAMRKAAAELS